MTDNCLASVLTMVCTWWDVVKSCDIYTSNLQ